MALDVKVKIDLTKPIGKKGFGYPLILEANAASGTSAIAYTECYSLADVISAGFDINSTVYKTASLLLSQDNAPEKFAVVRSNVDSATALASVLEKGWRQLIITDDSDAYDVAEAIEATDDKLFFTTITDKTAPVVNATKDYTRTVIFYYTSAKVSGACVEAALVGATAGLDVGSFTYKNIILNGVDPLDLTDSEIAEFTTNKIITIVSKAGDNVTTEGKVRKGEYIDIVDSRDYVLQQLEYKTQKLLNESKKIPYDNTGIAMLEATAIDVMQDAFNKGIIATDSNGTAMYSVNYSLASEVSSTDKTERKYVDGKFSFTLSGAIHEVEITGEIII